MTYLSCKWCDAYLFHNHRRELAPLGKSCVFLLMANYAHRVVFGRVLNDSVLNQCPHT